MIHTLVVDGSISLKEIKKKARRFAMTGGVEFALSPAIAASDVEKLLGEIESDLERYIGDPLRRKTSSAYRILELIAQEENLPDPLREAAAQHLHAAISTT